MSARNPNPFTVEKPTDIPDGAYVIMRPETYSTDGGYPEDRCHSYGYCGITVYPDKTSWEAALKRDVESKRDPVGFVMRRATTSITVTVRVDVSV
jgi:hypothetical protein